MNGALLVSPFGDQRWTRVHHADEVDADVGSVHAGVLLEVDELLGDRRTAAPMIGGPREPGVSGLVQLALPTGVVGATRRPIAVVGRLTVFRDLAFEPRTDLGAEGFVLLGVAKIHDHSFVGAIDAMASVRTARRSTFADSV